MEYIVEFSLQFEKSMKKLEKRDRALFIQIQKKLLNIVQDPGHYKPLKNVLAGYRRMHFGPFVIVFKIEGNVVRIISLDHHDKAY